jgi:hypothetical protein
VDPAGLIDPGQVTDTCLLALAVHHGGRLASLDQRPQQPGRARRRRLPAAHSRLTLMRTVNLAEAKAGLSALLDAVEAEDWVARQRRFHAHQPRPAASAVELLRELRDQEP